ncbi:MAG: quinone-interacting membrane-bound oxidoreductase complex subunit QmoC [Proteobacteria bacterium]|nr:quinone-interacting membrane-bound oxidoreductase complex subunit QmoC [Pseudomonadota bacterium]
MGDRKLLEPDVQFIQTLGERGADTLKKCYQCATCSVVCPISPDNKPFPRKEMIAASWGLSDKLVTNVDVWLCHQCGDCSAKCPRGARPGDVLGSVRSYAIQKYARPQWLARAVNDPKKLPILFAFPAVLFVVLGLITGLMDFTPELRHGHISHGMFFSSWLVDMIFVPSMTFALVVFAMGLKNFITDMHEAAVAEGKVARTDLNWLDLIKAAPKVILTILRHDKFSECGENKERATTHMMVLFGFIGLFIVTGVFFVVLYGSMAWFGSYELAWHSPYSQLNPVKWLANVAGIALLVGALVMLKNRLFKDEKVAKSSYQDWALIGLVLGLAVTGLGAEVSRLIGAATVTYVVYFVHLMFVFCLFVYLPFSKLAHLVYRTVAMLYAEYAGREEALKKAA